MWVKVKNLMCQRNTFKEIPAPVSKTAVLRLLLLLLSLLFLLRLLMALFLVLLWLQLLP